LDDRADEEVQQVISYVTKNESAYQQVRRAILDGELSPGARLNQERLAAHVGTSTTPLREALRRLHAEGLVCLDAHRDAHVTALSSSEARHITEIRLGLDPLAVELAATNHSEDDVQEMRLLLAQLGPIVDGTDDRVLEMHRRFHGVLYRASANPLLADLLDGLWDRTERYRRFGLGLLAGSGRRRDADFHEHFQLLDLVVEGQAGAAAALMRRHVEASLAALAQHTLAGEPSVNSTTESSPADVLTTHIYPPADSGPKRGPVHASPTPDPTSISPC
jgi:DNA-binding GntR family transcriptional regulator